MGAGAPILFIPSLGEDAFPKITELFLGRRRNARPVKTGRAFSRIHTIPDGPVRRGEPGYGPHLDRDNDGIGCEPYRGR